MVDSPAFDVRSHEQVSSLGSSLFLILSLARTNSLQCYFNSLPLLSP